MLHSATAPLALLRKLVASFADFGVCLHTCCTCRLPHWLGCASLLLPLLLHLCDLLCREFLSQVHYAWADKPGAGLNSEGHQPLGQCPAADRKEVWQALYALHSLYEVSL